MLDYHPLHFPCLDIAKATVFPLGWAMLLMVASTALVLVLVWWLSHVRQGQYGMAKPKCFCLMPRYMCPKQAYISPAGTSLADAPAAQRAVLSIQHLRKVFNDGKAGLFFSLRAKIELNSLLSGHSHHGSTWFTKSVTL